MSTTYINTNIQSNLNNKSPEKAKDTGYSNFENPLQANIIFRVNNGKPFTASKAACILLGYTKKELLAKNSTDIFDISNKEFSKLLKDANPKNNPDNLITLIKKNGKKISCEVTSAIFKDDDGIKKCIIAFADKSAGLLKQKNIDTKKEKIVAENIVIAISKQKVLILSIRRRLRGIL